MSGGPDPNKGKDALGVLGMLTNAGMVDTFLGGGGKGTLAGATAPKTNIGADMFPMSAAPEAAPQTAPTGFGGFGRAVDLGSLGGGGIAPGGVGQVQEAPEGRFGRFKEGLGNFSEDFFGSIDNTIQSPAKLLGIGLLNQMGGNRRYGTMGLLAKGAFDAFRGRRERREEESEPTYGGLL